MEIKKVIVWHDVNEEIPEEMFEIPYSERKPVLVYSDCGSVTLRIPREGHCSLGNWVASSSNRNKYLYWAYLPQPIENKCNCGANFSLKKEMSFCPYCGKKVR